jgi:hypothetical protein
MTFKKIWNALTSELREDLWNELTNEQKMNVMADFSQTQFNRLHEKLTPALKDKVDKCWKEFYRYKQIRKIIRDNHENQIIQLGRLRKGGKDKEAYDLKNHLDAMDTERMNMESAFDQIIDWYYLALGHMIILQKDVIDVNGMKLDEIERIERKYFWKTNEPIEKQKKRWDKGHEGQAKNINQDAFNDYGGITSNVASTYGTSNEQDEFCINPNNSYEDEHYVVDESGREPYSDNSDDGRNYDEC